MSLLAVGAQAIPASASGASATSSLAAAKTLAADSPVTPKGTALPYKGKPPASCATPPKSSSATDANRDRFIRLWAPRLANKAWFDNFVQAKTVPADIVAEGFHSMDQPTQAWLVACLVDNVLAGAHQKATESQVGGYQIALDLVIFDKNGLAAAKQKLNQSTPHKESTGPAPASALSKSGKDAAIYRASHSATITAKSLPKVSAKLIKPVTSAVQAAAHPSARLNSLQHPTTGSPKVLNSAKFVRANASAAPNRAKEAPAIVKSTAAISGPTVSTVHPNSLFTTLLSTLTVTILPAILNAIDELEQIVATIEQQLFTIPPLNIVATLFYRVCGESATMPLECSILLPIGVPIPADLTGDHVPDVLAELIPYVGGTNPADVNISFSVTRMNTKGLLPAHIFFVYDVPIISKRVEYGYDGRASTLANQTNTTVTLHHAYTALTGDVDISASVVSKKPGAVEALTFAVKDLIGGSPGHQPTEANPMVGAVQFNPFPAKFSAEAHLTHGVGGTDEDVFTVNSSVASTVNAVMDQDTTTTTPQSHRQFTALIDKLPTSVIVDLVQNGGVQTITYTASGTIAHAQASDTDTPNTAAPTTYTQDVFDVLGVPKTMKVTLNTSNSAQDVLYQASSKITQVSFTTQTYKLGVLQSAITAQALQIPTMVHFNMTNGSDTNTYTYNANAVLPSVAFSMYNLTPTETMSINATVSSIPTQLQFSQTQSTGVYDFIANNPIGEIQANLSINNGAVLGITGEDHATVYKRGTGLGADFQLSGFQAAHFDGSQKTALSMVLNPGGQAFQAIADLDSPNIYATAHVSALPSSMAVTIDPVGGSATYSASSIIPELDGAFTQRDTSTTANFILNNLPKNITATWAISGTNPQVTYSADSQLGQIQGFYQQAPGGLSFQATIANLPKYMLISGTAPIVFDARTSAGAASGSGSIGTISFNFASDGNFAAAPTTDDYALLDTTGAQTHANVLYHGLAYINIDTTNGQIHAEVRNSAPRLFRMFATTPDLSASGFIDSVPADVKVDMVGNDIQYHASSVINEIFTQLTRTSGDTISADVKGIPASIDLTFDAASSQVVWSSSSVVGSISINAHLTAATLGMSRDFDGALTISGIPTAWSVGYGNGNVDFTTNGAGIGLIAASVTNHTSVHTLPGDHLSAYYDQGSGDLDASLQVSNLHSIHYHKLTDNSGGGLSAGLSMGSGGSLGLSAEIHLGTNSLIATGSFDHLPTVISLVSDGGHITYSGSLNPTLTLSVAAGDNNAIAATPTPNNVNGISIRDGQSGGNFAIKANISLVGLPTGLDFNTVTGIYTVSNYAPGTVNPLVLDVALNALTPQPATLYATQAFTSSPVSFTFGPFTSVANPDGSHTTNVLYSATSDLGALDAEATYGSAPMGVDAKLHISNIPQSVNVSANFGNGTDAIHIHNFDIINDIHVWFRFINDTAAQSLGFDASADLTAVPKTVDMVIGRGSSQINGGTDSAPDFSYTASTAGLGITASADGYIVNPGSFSATAVVSLVVVNIGQQVTATLNGTDIHLTSSPKTTSFSLDAAADIIFTISLNGSFLGFTNQGSLTVNANITDLNIGFMNASVLDVNLGVTTGITGDFTQFTLGETSDTQVDIWDDLDLCLDFPLGIGTQCFDAFDLADAVNPAHWDLMNVIDHWHLDIDQEQNIFHIPALEFGVANCGVDITANPMAPTSNADRNVSQMVLGPAPAGQDGLPDAWLITPDPRIGSFTLPDFALDAIAFFESPYGNHIGAGFSCDWGPF